MRRHGLRRDPPLAISLCSVSHDVPSSIRRVVHAQLIAEVGEIVRRLGSSHCLTPLAATWPRWADPAGVEMQGISPVREIAGIKHQVGLMGFRQTGH